VVGVDMTDEMLDKARVAALRMGLSNVAGRTSNDIAPAQLSSSSLIRKPRC